MKATIQVFKNAVYTKTSNRRMTLKKSGNTTQEGETIYVVIFKRLVILDKIGIAPEVNNNARFYIVRPHSKYGIMINKVALSETAMHNA